MEITTSSLHPRCFREPQEIDYIRFHPYLDTKGENAFSVVTFLHAEMRGRKEGKRARDNQ